MAEIANALTESVAAVVRLMPSCSGVAAMSDDTLLRSSEAIAAARRELDAHGGWVAAEISRRSRRELGYDGLAQRQGFRTPEALIQKVTGSSRADATTLVRVGTMVADTAAADALVDSLAADPTGTDPNSERPTPFAPIAGPDAWRAPIARAVASGDLSYAQAEAIRAGLGDPTDVITGEVLTEAIAVLVDAATNPDAPLTVDQLRRLSRQLRDSVDAEGLAEQEKAQQDAQYLKTWKRSDGMIGGSLLLDRENGAYLLSVIDGLTSPRRGGPRFVDPHDRARAQSLIDDPRSAERIAADGIIQLLRIGSAADPNRVFGSRKPAVRIVVTRASLHGAAGSDGRGIIEDTGESISIAAVQRSACESGHVAVTVDPTGKPLDVGREERLFTARQKIALAVRDGGCMVGGCDRPPSWTEAHHIDHFAEHHGLTNTEDGILLCRYHHLSLHNNGWRILRDDGRYFLRRSRAEDPEQNLIELHSKNPLTQTHLAQQHHHARQHAHRQRAG